MCDVLNEFDQPHVPDVVRDLFTNMHELLCQAKKSYPVKNDTVDSPSHGRIKIDPAELSLQIRNLQPKQMMGIYVRNANCGLMLMRSPSDDSDRIAIATFQPNLTNEQIYGTDDNISGDIQVNIRDTITIQFLDSKNKVFFCFTFSFNCIGRLSDSCR